MKRLACFCSVLLVAMSAEVLVLVKSVDRVDTPRSVSQAPGQTWVIVGSDDRAFAPEYDGTSYKLGRPPSGGRADIVLVVQVDGDKVQAMSLPRDLEVTPAPSFHPGRLSVVLTEGEAAFTSALCLDLGIPTDHLVVVHLDGFVGLVDTLGGVKVDLPLPMRDALTGLNIEKAGPTVLQGHQALALVRSRHAEQLIDGQWQPVTEAQGSTDRAHTAGKVMKAIASQLPGALRDPFRAHNLAWAAAQGVVVDSRTSLFDALQLKSVGAAPIQVLPVDQGDSIYSVRANQETRQALARAGYVQGQCTM